MNNFKKMLYELPKESISFKMQTTVPSSVLEILQTES